MQETPPTEENPRGLATAHQRSENKTIQALEAMKKAEAELVDLRVQIEAHSPARVRSLTSSQQLHENTFDSSRKKSNSRPRVRCP